MRNLRSSRRSAADSTPTPWGSASRRQHRLTHKTRRRRRADAGEPQPRRRSRSRPHEPTDIRTTENREPESISMSDTQQSAANVQTPANGKRKRLMALLAGVILIAAIAYGFYYFLVARFHEETDDA